MNGAKEWLQVDRPPGATLLEIPICLLVVLVMASIAVSTFATVRRHLAALDAVAVASGTRVSMTEYRAVTGRWPASNREAGIVEATAEYIGSGRVRGIAVRPDGAVDVGFGRDGTTDRIVSLRAWEGASAESPVGWVCADSAAPRGTMLAPDHTTMTAADLPSPCRTRP